MAEVLAFARPALELEVSCVLSDAVLTALWPFVRKGLTAIKKRQERDHPSRSTWTPEHVLRMLREGFLEATRPNPPWVYPTTQLWIGHEAGALDAPCAFTITQVATDPWLNVTNSFFVWMAYADPRAPRRVVKLIDAYIESVARLRGYTHLECLTARPGLGRRLGRLGWHTVMHVLRKDLD